MGIFHWIFGKHPPRPPDPERSCEVAWLPLWQSQMVLHALLEHDIPAVVSEDFSSHYRGGSFQPMAWIFVMEPRRAEAEQLIEEITGYPPAHHDR